MCCRRQKTVMKLKVKLNISEEFEVFFKLFRNIEFHFEFNDYLLRPATYWLGVWGHARAGSGHGSRARARCRPGRVRPARSRSSHGRPGHARSWPGWARQASPGLGLARRGQSLATARGGQAQAQALQDGFPENQIREYRFKLTL